MKLLTLVVKPFRLADVVAAAVEAGAGGATVSEVKGFGRQGGHSESYRGNEYRIEFVPKVRVDVIVPAEKLDAVLRATAAAARTGRIGDGKAWVHDLAGVTRIRTGEAGADAV